MSRSRITGLALVAGLFASATAAHATVTVSAAVGGAPTGVNYANFDDLALGSAGGISDGIGVAFDPDGQAVQGSVSGVYAAPYLSNGNGVPFGDAENGPDTTTFLSTGLGSVTLTFPGLEKYMGLLWGSVDAYNTLSLYDGAALVGSITGTKVTAGANGDQGVNGTYYVNINSTLPFNKVVATSTQYAFEFDNVAYNRTAVPEPATLALFVSGLIGLTAIRRRHVANARR
ncbi:MAG TPA: PEP-CTERM sorting domain-containing protein [Acetobacteraceae bacterium]